MLLKVDSSVHKIGAESCVSAYVATDGLDEPPELFLCWDLWVTRRLGGGIGREEE